MCSGNPFREPFAGIPVFYISFCWTSRNSFPGASTTCNWWPWMSHIDHVRSHIKPFIIQLELDKLLRSHINNLHYQFRWKLMSKHLSAQTMLLLHLQWFHRSCHHRYRYSALCLSSTMCLSSTPSNQQNCRSLLRCQTMGAFFQMFPCFSK